MPDEHYAQDKLAALIGDIHECAGLYGEIAASHATKAIRKPTDEYEAGFARQWVTIHDARKMMAGEMVDLVWKHWPRVAEAEPAKPPTKAS